MIKRIIESLFRRRVFFVFEDQLLLRFASDSNEMFCNLLLLQLKNIKNSIRSDDGRVVKLQYGRQRSILETQISLDISQKESVIGRITFKQGCEEINVLQIIQINGLISILEYRHSPDPMRLDGELVVVDCELYLKSRKLVDPVMLIDSIHAIPHFGGFIVLDPRPPGWPDEVSGAEACFPEIPRDYFQLCSVCDGFLANGWEFLGLRFRHVNEDCGGANTAFILAQFGHQNCIALAKDGHGEWRQFLAEINTEDISLKRVKLLDSSFQVAFAKLVK